MIIISRVTFTQLFNKLFDYLRTNLEMDELIFIEMFNKYMTISSKIFLEKYSTENISMERADINTIVKHFHNTELKGYIRSIFPESMNAYERQQFINKNVEYQYDTVEFISFFLKLKRETGNLTMKQYYTTFLNLMANKGWNDKVVIHRNQIDHLCNFLEKNSDRHLKLVKDFFKDAFQNEVVITSDVFRQEHDTLVFDKLDDDVRLEITVLENQSNLNYYKHNNEITFIVKKGAKLKLKTT